MESATGETKRVNDLHWQMRQAYMRALLGQGAYVLCLPIEQAPLQPFYHMASLVAYTRARDALLNKELNNEPTRHRPA